MKDTVKKGFAQSLYEDIYMLGDGYKRAFSAVFGFIFKVIFRVFRGIASFFAAVFAFFGKGIMRCVRVTVNEIKSFFGEVRRAAPSLSASFKEKPSEGFKLFWRYVKKSFSVHKKFGRAVLSVVIPIIVLSVLVSVISSFRGLTFAVNVYIDGENIGTVSDENAYREAMLEAQKRLDAIPAPEYKTALAFAGDLDDVETVCNNIISAVSENAVNACGIYVNDEFLCAVESENTFVRVRDKILDSYSEDSGYLSANYRVEFADEITAVSGVFPENYEIWDSDKLYKYMSGKNMKIKTTYTYIQVETTPFDTVSQYDNNLLIGTTMTILEGVPGRDVVSYTDTYIDGELVSSENEILRYNANPPVNRLIKIGTKGIPVDENNIPVSPRLLRDQGGTFVWPAPQNCFWLSQRYKSNAHYGIDIVSSDSGSSRGRPIVAVADGVVVTVVNSPSWGNYVRIDHGDGVVTGYAHALDGSFMVKVGDYVKQGQQISSIGTTGHSTGYHLHFEVFVDGVRVDPLPYIYSETLGIAVK